MNITLGLILVIVGTFGIIFSISMILIVHKNFKKKENELLKNLNDE